MVQTLAEARIIVHPGWIWLNERVISEIVNGGVDLQSCIDSFAILEFIQGTALIPNLS
jgi:hypothetical protein